MVQAGEEAYNDAERLGRLLGEAGYSVATGGYSGVMEAVSSGARSAGADVIGITAPPVFPLRSGVNGYVTKEIPANSMSERIHRLIDLPDAYVVLGGSIGTLTELMVAWNTAFVTRFSDSHPKPIVAVGPPWQELVPHLAGALRTDLSYVSLVAGIDDVLPKIGARLSA